MCPTNDHTILFAFVGVGWAYRYARYATTHKSHVGTSYCLNGRTGTLGLYTATLRERKGVEAPASCPPYGHTFRAVRARTARTKYKYARA